MRGEGKAWAKGTASAYDMSNRTLHVTLTKTQTPQVSTSLGGPSSTLCSSPFLTSLCVHVCGLGLVWCVGGACG